MGEMPAGEWVPHTIEVGGLVAVVLLPPGLPRLKAVELNFAVETEDELRTVVAAVGGIGKFVDPGHTTRLMSVHRYAVHDDEIGCDVHVWLGEALALQKLAPTAPPVVTRLLEEQAERDAAAARLEANERAVEWAQGVGRPVELRDGEVVEQHGRAGE